MTTTKQRGRYGRYITNVLIISDFIVVNLVYALILWLNPEVWHGHVRLVGLLVNIAYVPAALISREVRSERAIHMDRMMLSTLRGIGFHALIFFSLLYFLSITPTDWYVYVELYGGWLIGLPLWGVISRLLLKALRRSGRNYTRVVIVGTSATATRLYEEMKSDPGFGFRVLGFVDYAYPAHFPYRKLFVGTLDTLGTYVRDHAVDQVYYCLGGEDDYALRLSIQAADDNISDFYFVPQMSRYLNRSFGMSGVGAIPVMSIRSNPLASMMNRGLKRLFDIVVSGTFLVVSPIIFVPVAIAIKLSSPGPVFFRQKRTGYRGKPFDCLKFRTMRVNSDADRVQASKDDPRKTKIGDFLRRTSIDELPQFINVLKGDMSVVGPRPHMLAHTEQYSQLIDQYMVRHIVQPGITGWAQVNGYRGRTEQLWQMEKRVEYDTWYIENWSFMLDLKIVGRTVINMFHGEKNAY